MSRLGVGGPLEGSTYVCAGIADSSASAEALEELIAHATQQDERPAGRRREISRRLQDYQAYRDRARCYSAWDGCGSSKRGAGPKRPGRTYSVIGPDVVLEADVRLQSHVVIDGKTRDKKHQLFEKDEYGDMTLTIGSNCVIREHVTVHGSTSYSQAPTSVGDDAGCFVGLMWPTTRSWEDEL
ncbi:Trimeric LpxA-like [Phytophthora cactorum]|nr:Trimeric LpxA-like [Phytophthora cactorum]